MNDDDREYFPKGWYVAVRHIFNGVYDAHEALRRNNPRASAALIMSWLHAAIIRGTTKYKRFT